MSSSTGKDRTISEKLDLRADIPFYKSAQVTAREVLKIKQGEKILIITNPDEESFTVSSALYEAVMEYGGIPCLVIQQRKDQLDFADDAVIGAIKSSPDVIISISRNKLGKDRKAIASPYKIGEKSYDSTFHYLVEGVKKSRSFWSPGITADMFRRTVAIDYARLKKECLFLKSILDKASAVKIQSAAGTDFEISIEGRETFCDDGDFSFNGSGGNLPAGEVFISPVVGKSSGTIVYDGSISTKDGDLIISTPIRVKVEDGFVTEIDGGEEADILRDTIDAGKANALLFEKEGKLPPGRGEVYRKNAGNIGELGIGLNPAAEIRGNMLEDEKAYRTCHIAIGSNYDDDAPSLIHLDGLIKEPTITAFFPGGGSSVIMEKGDLTADMGGKKSG